MAEYISNISLNNVDYEIRDQRVDQLSAEKVSVTPQELSEAQKAQARANIGIVKNGVPNLFDINNLLITGSDTGNLNRLPIVEGDVLKLSGWAGNWAGSVVYVPVKENSEVTFSAYLYGETGRMELFYFKDITDQGLMSEYVAAKKPTVSTEGVVAYTVTIPAGYNYFGFCGYSASQYGMCLKNIEITNGDAVSGIIDDTLSIRGYIAEAAAVGNALTDIRNSINTPFRKTSIKSINHRGYNTEAPENTLSAYRLSKKRGFQFVEADINLTSDNIPVLLHDNTIDRTSNGSGAIRELTLEAVKALDFGSWFSEDYAGEKIPTLEEFLVLCKNLNLHAYLDLRAGDTDSEADILVNTVKKCGMKNNVTWLSASEGTLRKIKERNATAKLAVLTTWDAGITEANVTAATTLKTDINDVVIHAQHNYLSDEAVQMCIDADIPLEAWIVNEETTLLGLPAYITGVSSDSLNAAEIFYESAMSV